LFRGLDDLVEKKLGPVIQSIEKKLTPEMEKLVKALERHVDATEANTRAVKELKRTIDSVYQLLDDK
jgi:endonuclease V-like protein UPF0215 family